jgi:hypothetical protein
VGEVKEAEKKADAQDHTEEDERSPRRFSGDKAIGRRCSNSSWGSATRNRDGIGNRMAPRDPRGQTS